MSSSERVMPFSFDIIETNSFQLKSAQDNVIIKRGKPSCFTIANTSNKKYFQYAGVPLMVFIKLNASSLATKDLTDSLKFQLICLHFLHNYVDSTA